MEWFLMGLSVVTAIVGIGIAYRMYVQQPALSDRMAAAAGGFYKLLLHKYYIDEIYDALFVNRVKNLGNALAAFDVGVIDGGVNGAGWITRMAAEVSRLWDTWVIDGLVNVVAAMVKLLSYPAKIVQTGVVQNYAWFITVGVLIFMLYFVMH
jgi:NADH-quinone oxidoreductase subunit L